MSKHVLRSVFALACALAAGAFSAAGANAQSAESLRQGELQRSSAPTLYEAISQLRPEWLHLGDDGAAGSSVERVLVFLNGHHVGNLHVLHTIQTADVLGVRVRSPEYVRRTDPRFPRQEYAPALFVDTRGAAPARPRGRVTVSLDAGYNLRSLPRVAREALRDQGYATNYADAPKGVIAGREDGTTSPPTFGATVHYRATGGWGGALNVNHTLEGRAGGMNRARETAAVSTTLTSTEAALLVTREASVMRVGVGPAVRTVNWAWSDGYCDCGTEDRSTNAALGLAAELATTLPLGSAAVFPQLKVLARYYPSQRTEYSQLDEPLQTGGLVMTMGVSLVVRP
jgi:hypothetical protein